jgi:hypothetical protein
MKVGDLVKARDYCNNSHRMAIIVEKPERFNVAKFRYVDNLELGLSTIENLEIVSDAA